MTFRRIFKRDRPKNPGNESPGSVSGSDTPPPAVRVQRTMATPTHELPAGVLASVTQPFFSSSSSALIHQKPNEEWPNLEALSKLLNQSGVFSPLAEVMDDLCWFVRVHENICAVKEEYKTLRAQLEGLCGDLRDHFSRGAPPVITTSVHNLCRTIRTELMEVYGTQNRNDISRYLQANQDLDKITRCYRRIHGHLERVMLNASLSTLKIVDDQATEARLRGLNPTMSACYDSAEANMVQRRECAPKTREQVLLDLETWKNNPDGEKVCWINGMAGTGKTTIATSLCSTLHKSHELGASFFCTRSIPACRDAKLILPTIAYQLARFSIPFRGALLQVLDRDPDVHTKVPQAQFQRMVLEPLQAAVRSLPSIVVVIDALDECEDENGVGQILEVLLENSSELPIKFLVSSRPEHHIRDKIRKSTAKRQLVLHELDEKMVKADIETYLRAELASVSTVITNGQLSTLVERAGALFIYAATVVRYIKRGNTTERLATVLGVSGPGHRSVTQTKEIDRLYETVLISAFTDEDLEEPEIERMRLCLHTIVIVQEPLTIDALASLLGLTSNQVADALKPLWSVLYLSESNLAHRVSPLHASFPDYLLDPDRAQRFAFNVEMHNVRLAGLCMIRVRQNVSQFNTCDLQSSYLLDNHIPDLNERVKQKIPQDLLYACQYWATHLAKSGTQNEQTPILHEFLSKRLLLWMEILNLSNRIDQAVGQIEKAMKWLTTIGLSAGDHTVSLARDAMRFATIFATSPVCRSTPHLYVSMLSSWPHDQPISKCYMARTKNLINLKGVETSERQLSLLSLISVGSEIRSVSYSPTGAFFAAGTWDKEILIWDAASCRMTIDPIRGHTEMVQAIAISPDGTQICSCSRDKTFCIWDPQTGRLIEGPIEGHTSLILSIAYSPNGQWLVSGSIDGEVGIWDTHTWQLKGNPLNANNGRVFAVAFSPDSSVIAASSESLIHFWDPAGGQMKGEPLKGHTYGINTLAFTPDGKYLISGSDDHAIRILDVSTGQIAFGPLQEHLSEVDCIAVSPDGKLLASASTDNTIRLWDTKSWTTRSLFRHSGIARSVAFSPDSSRLVSGSKDKNLRVWEVMDASDEKAVEEQTKGSNGQIGSVAFSPCGTYIVSGSDDTAVCLWDAQTGQPIGSALKGHNDWVTRVGVSATGNRIFSVSRDRMIRVWDRQTGELEHTIGPVETDGDYKLIYQEFWPAVYLFDTGRVVCGSNSGRIYIWENDRLVSELNGHTNPVYSLAVSTDGQSFASGDGNGNLALWDTTSGETRLGPFKAQFSSINSVSFSPDDTLVASDSDGCTIRLWNTHTGASVGDPFRGHVDVIRSVVFSPKGKYIASGSQDMTVRLWDIASGQSIAVFEGHSDFVYSVAFSPDGARIVSGSGDMAIRIWNAPIPDQPTAGGECEDRASQPTKITEENDALRWTMDEHGWVQDNEHHLLLWVPPDLRSVLLRSHNELLISRQGCIELDFSNARTGDAWATCYEPFPPSTEG